MTPNERLALLAVAVSAALAAAGSVLYRLRVTPAQKELRRRLNVHLHGRLGDGILTDTQDDTLYFSYTVAGVSYTASQDVSAIRAQVPPDPAVLVGPVTLKYLPRNPANSIVLCEEWSGLRSRSKVN